MKKKRLILRYVKQFLLSILILLTTITTILSLTILNRSFIEKQFTTKHYEKVETELKTKMKESMISSGIDNKVIDTMFQISDVKKTTEETIDILYNYNNQTLNTKKIRSQLEQNIKDNLAEKQLVLDNEDDFNKFVDSIMDIYEDEFKMLNHLSTVGKLLDKLIKVCIILTITLGVLSLIIITINYRKMPKYLPTALFTTSFVILFGGNYIYNTAGLSRITIFSVTFSDILRKIINNTFNTFYIVSIIYIIIGIVLCCFVKRHRHRHHHHHHSE